MWKKIGKEEIKSVPVGARVRIRAREEYVLTRHYAGDDFGFEIGGVRSNISCGIFTHEMWARDYAVEVWEKPTESKMEPSFKDMKFRVDSTEHALLIQKTLIGMGYDGFLSLLKGVCGIFAHKNGGVGYTTDSERFLMNPYPEYKIQPIGYECVPITKQMTKEQIEEALGHKVDIIGS